MSSHENTAPPAAEATLTPEELEAKQIAGMTEALTLDVLKQRGMTVDQSTGPARITYRRPKSNAELSFLRWLLKADPPETDTVKFAVCPKGDGIDPVVNVYAEADIDDPQTRVEHTVLLDSLSARINTDEETIDFGHVVTFPEVAASELHSKLSDLQASGAEPTIAFFPSPVLDPR